MNFRKFLISKPKLATFVLSIVNPEIIEKLAQKSAWKTYKTAVTTDAYSDVIKQKFSGDIPKEIKFKDLPILDKNNYIKKYSHEELSLKGNNPIFFFRSSGYSGKPTYWSQDTTDFDNLVDYARLNLQYVFNIKTQKTLIISMYAMSSWITGQQVLASISKIIPTSSKLTFFTCGMNFVEALDILKTHGHKYEQIIIFTYPLTFNSFVNLAEKEHFDLKSFNIKVVVGAEMISREWFKYFSAKLGYPKKEERFGIYSAYGTADTGVGIGSESVTSLSIKEIIYSKPEIWHELTGQENLPVHLFQYNPIDTFLESIDGEIVVTKLKNIPLVRYNLKDRGQVVKVSNLLSVFSKFGFDIRKIIQEQGVKFLNLPFFSINGRSDATIILNGANIYIDSFQNALNQNSLQKLHTGKFRVEKFENEDMTHGILLSIELREGITVSEEIKKTIRDSVINWLVENDKGYAGAFHKEYESNDTFQVKFVSFEGEITLKHKFIQS